jgi:hypothetical protein
MPRQAADALGSMPERRLDAKTPMERLAWSR